MQCQKNIAAADDSLVLQLRRYLHARHPGRDVDEGLRARTGRDQQREGNRARHHQTRQEHKKKKTSHEQREPFL